MRITFFCAACLSLSWLCEGQTIRVRNTLATDRQMETVSIPASKLSKTTLATRHIQAIDAKTGEKLQTQWIDIDGDSVAEELIFQVTLASREEKRFMLRQAAGPGNAESPRAYSRFVPERTDDYAWENDKVAFRTYGPTAQQLVEEGKPGGTLSSGIDCWLKRVSHPVIDAWYRKNATGGSYHKDTGEGLDNYHVGASRGCGGIGVWMHDSLYVSKNFVRYKTIARGPIRTIFELTYAPWMADDIVVTEKKRISLDVGSQLSRFEVTLQTATPLPNVAVGITLHEKRGKTYADTLHGVFSYWEPLDDSELGTGVVTDANHVRYTDYRTGKKDLSQLYAIIKPEHATQVYYAGFGWKKAGRFANAEAWKNYLQQFAQQLRSPVEVEIERDKR